jgi:hypothetical protein
MAFSVKALAIGLILFVATMAAQVGVEETTTMPQSSNSGTTSYTPQYVPGQVWYDQQLKDLQSIIETQRAYIETLEKRISDLEKNENAESR